MSLYFRISERWIEETLLSMKVQFPDSRGHDQIVRLGAVGDAKYNAAIVNGNRNGAVLVTVSEISL